MCEIFLRRPAIHAVLICVGCGLSATEVARSFEHVEATESLSAQALALRDRYRAIDPAVIDASRSQLQDNLTELEDYLREGDVVGGWRTYLHWDELDEQLAAEEPDVDELREIMALFFANLAGLEQSRFRAAGRSLEEYIDQLAIASLPNAAEYHAERMESLAKALSGFGAEPTGARRRAIADGLDWLRRSGQAAELVDAVHGMSSHPNLHVEASARFVSAGLSQPVEYTDPIRDQILGASISGQGRTSATMRGGLISDPQRAAMQLDVTGRTDSSTVGRKRHVTAWGDGVTTFTSRKRLTFDVGGFSGGVSSSCARSNNRVRCISAQPLVKQLARIQLEHQADEGNRIAAQHAIPLINRRIDQEADAIIDAANAAYQREFRDPLVRADAFPQQVRLHTTPEKLEVNILQASEGQMGASIAAPPPALAHDIALRMHETAFENMAESLLAGRTLTDDELRADVARYLTMASLEQYTPAADDQPWSVTLARRHPVTVDFQDGAYTLTIAGERWTSGRRSFRALNASVTYRIESSNSQVRLKRDEEILIAPPGFERGKGRLSPLVISARRVLQRKLDELLPEEINPEDLVVPGPWEKAGPLRVVSMTADSGWLEASWEMSPSSAAEAIDRRADFSVSKE